MTTTAFDDQFTPSTQTIEIVHAPYEPVAILKRNVAELELALKRQTERAEKTEEKLTTARDDMQSWIDSRNGWMERAGAAEAELAKLRDQEPVAWRHENGNIFLPWQKDLIVTGAVFSPLYAAPVPASAVLSVSSNVLEMLDGVFADTATGQKYLSEARALLQSAEVQAVDKWQLTPATTHPVDRKAGEVRHENNV